MRKSQASFSVAVAVVLTMAPEVATAGPCSSGIEEFETALHQFGGNPVNGLGQQSVNPQLSHQPMPDLATRLQPQFSATMARAKRLDRQGDRVGCIGALNAARRMYVLVDKQ